MEGALGCVLDTLGPSRLRGTQWYRIKDSFKEEFPIELTVLVLASILRDTEQNTLVIEADGFSVFALALPDPSAALLRFSALGVVAALAMRRRRAP